LTVEELLLHSYFTENQEDISAIIEEFEKLTNIEDNAIVSI